jgi:hypothetical protein
MASVLLCGALFVAGMGSWVFAAGVRAAVLGALSRRWPAVRGRVRESRVDETSRGASLVVRYDYEVASVAHTGNNLGFASPGSRWIRTQERNEVRDAAERQYSADREVDVFYWPARPSVSVLQPGFHQGSVALLAVGSLWLGVGVAIGALLFLRYG